MQGKFLFSKHLKFQQKLNIFLVLNYVLNIFRHRQHSEQEADFSWSIVSTFLWVRPCYKYIVFSATWKFTDFALIICRIIWTLQSFMICIFYGSSSVSSFVYKQIIIMYFFPIPLIFFFLCVGDKKK